MTTTKSYSSDSRFFSMYKAALKNQLPFAVISGILFMIILVVVFFASIMDQNPEMYYSTLYGTGAKAFFTEYFQQGIYVGFEQSAVVMAFLAVLVLCSALFGLSYMHNKKTVDLYHSLPVTRSQLLTANALASQTAVFGPFLGMYLLTMLIQLIGFGHYGCFGPAYFQFILFDLSGMLVYCLALHLFIALIAVNVGTVFDTFAVTMAVGFTPMVLYLISGLLWSLLTYGASFEPSENLILSLSPFTFMFQRYVDGYADYSSSIRTYDYFRFSMLLLAGMAVAAVFYAAALVCYKRRKSEVAEQTQSRGVLQTVVKCVAAFIGAAAFFGIFYRTNIVVRLIAVLFGSVVVGLIAELILSRGVRFLKKNIILLLGAGGVYCVLLLFVYFDVFGYTQRVPLPEDVQSVTVSYNGRFNATSGFVTWYREDGRDRSLTSPESIETVVNMHRLTVQNIPPENTVFLSSNDMDYEYNYVNLEYKLKNGRTMKRSYSGRIYMPAYRVLADLEDKADFIAANSLLFQMETAPVPQENLISFIELYGDISSPDGKLSPQVVNGGWRELINALKTDMQNESLSEIQNPTRPALGYLAIHYKNDAELGENFQRVYYDAPIETILITQEFKNTLALLRQWNMEQELKSDLSNVRSVEISQVWDSPYSYDRNRVGLILPGKGSYYAQSFRDYQYADGEMTWENTPLREDGMLFASSTSADVIAAVANVGISRILPPDNQEAWYKEYVIACFVYDDLSSCVKLVRLSDLPEELRARVRENLEKAYDEAFAYSEKSGEPIIPEIPPEIPEEVLAEMAVNS